MLLTQDAIISNLVLLTTCQAEKRKKKETNKQEVHENAKGG